MGQVAHIRYDGGALLLPAQDPYDREIVFEEAEFCARRHGAVGVQFGRREMRIRISAADAIVPCEDCHTPIGLLSFLIDRHLFCSHCAKRCMGCSSQPH
jgi:hypothetical protein